MIFEEDGDQVVQVGEPCPSCGSHSTEFRPSMDCWKCEDCSTVWGPQDYPQHDIVPMDSWIISDDCCLDPDDSEYEYVRYISGLKMD